MRFSLADVALCVLLVGIAGCGTGGGGTPQGNDNTPRPATPTPTAGPTAKPTATPTATASPTPKPTVTPTATPTPVATPTGAPTPALNNWPTYGYDNARDGFNPNTSAITPASIAQLHLAWLASLNEVKTQSQPIIATNIAGHAGILIVGGDEGSVYGYDALSGKPIWERSVGNATITCPGTPPSPLGVGGTAVYDPATQSIYIGSNLNTVSNGPSQLFMNKIGAADGSLLGTVNFAPNPLAGEVNFTHTSITLANGILYAGTGSTCDISSWRGRIVAVNESTMTLANTFFTVWNQSLSTTTPPAPYSGGGVWGWGGVSIDAAGKVWSAVGNLDVQQGATAPKPPFVTDTNEFDAFGEHVIQMSPDLKSVLQNNYPVFTFNPPRAVDLDINGTPVIAENIGCHETAAVQGKSGYLYIYDTSNAAQGPTDRLRFTASTYLDPNLGNPAFSPITGLYYAAVASSVSGGINPSPGMVAINPCDTASSVVWATAFGPDSAISNTPRSMPTVTAGGVVFLGTPCRLDNTGGCTGDGNFGGAVWALDAGSGAILNGGRPLITTPHAIRVGPVVDGDWVYVFDTSGSLFGLTIDPKYPTINNTLARKR